MGDFFESRKSVLEPAGISSAFTDGMTTWPLAPADRVTASAGTSTITCPKNFLVFSFTAMRKPLIFITGPWNTMQGRWEILLQ